MSEALTLSAESRERAGKGASRAHRREGRVPAVIYGGKQDPIAVHVEEKALVKMLHTGHFMNSVIEISVGGTVERTLPRDVQFNVVSDRPTHVDFLRVGADSKITVNVPVRFVDEEESPGIKRGGVLNVVRHDIEVTCPSNAIPDDLVVSLAGLDVGASIHISAFKLPNGVVPTISDRDFTVATLVAPSALKSEEGDTADAPAAEGEAAPEA